MRIRRLLFLLAPTLLGGATPVHAALGPAPKCLPLETTRGTTETVDVKPPIAELSEPVPNYDPEDRDYLIRTIVFEAADEPDEGKAAIAYVILNRKRSGRWGENIKDVVTRPWQFEPWMTRRREMEKLAPDDARYQVRRGSRMPFSLAKCPILLRAQPTSSIRQSFDKGGAVPCHHGRVVRDSLSASTRSIRLMRPAPCWRDGTIHRRIGRSPFMLTPGGGREALRRVVGLMTHA